MAKGLNTCIDWQLLLLSAGDVDPVHGRCIGAILGSWTSLTDKEVASGFITFVGALTRDVAQLMAWKTSCLCHQLFRGVSGTFASSLSSTTMGQRLALAFELTFESFSLALLDDLVVATSRLEELATFATSLKFSPDILVCWIVCPDVGSFLLGELLGVIEHEIGHVAIAVTLRTTAFIIRLQFFLLSFIKGFLIFVLSFIGLLNRGIGFGNLSHQSFRSIKRTKCHGHLLKGHHGVVLHRHSLTLRITEICMPEQDAASYLGRKSFSSVRFHILKSNFLSCNIGWERLLLGPFHAIEERLDACWSSCFQEGCILLQNRWKDRAVACLTCQSLEVDCFSYSTRSRTFGKALQQFESPSLARKVVVHFPKGQLSQPSSQSVYSTWPWRHHLLVTTQCCNKSSQHRLFTIHASKWCRFSGISSQHFQSTRHLRGCRRHCSLVQNIQHRSRRCRSTLSAGCSHAGLNAWNTGCSHAGCPSRCYTMNDISCLTRCINHRPKCSATTMKMLRLHGVRWWIARCRRSRKEIELRCHSRHSCSSKVLLVPKHRHLGWTSTHWVYHLWVLWNMSKTSISLRNWVAKSCQRSCSNRLHWAHRSNHPNATSAHARRTICMLFSSKRTGTWAHTTRLVVLPCRWVERPRQGWRMTHWCVARAKRRTLPPRITCRACKRISHHQPGREPGLNRAPLPL